MEAGPDLLTAGMWFVPRYCTPAQSSQQCLQLLQKSSSGPQLQPDDFGRCANLTPFPSTYCRDDQISRFKSKSTIIPHTHTDTRA